MQASSSMTLIEGCHKIEINQSLGDHDVEDIQHEGGRLWQNEGNTLNLKCQCGNGIMDNYSKGRKLSPSKKRKYVECEKDRKKEIDMRYQSI